jgi:Tol biopolymer transport system component
VDGRNLRRLTLSPKKPNGEPADSVSPAWSPDGGLLAFLSNRRGSWEIWVMGANGANLRPLFGAGLEGLQLDYAYVGERAISWTK